MKEKNEQQKEVKSDHLDLKGTESLENSENLDHLDYKGTELVKKEKKSGDMSNIKPEVEENSSEEENRKFQELMATENTETEKEISENCVCVKNVSDHVNVEDIKSLFKSCGIIKSVTFNRRRRFSFIEFKNKKSVFIALKLTRSMLKGKKIGVFKKKAFDK